MLKKLIIIFLILNCSILIAQNNKPYGRVQKIEMKTLNFSKNKSSRFCSDIEKANQSLYSQLKNYSGVWYHSSDFVKLNGVLDISSITTPLPFSDVFNSKNIKDKYKIDSSVIDSKTIIYKILPFKNSKTFRTLEVKNHKMVSSKIYIDNKKVPYRNVKYEFYPNNNFKAIIYYENGKSTYLKFKYKYDRNGNWIKQTKYVNNVKHSVWKRKITYVKTTQPTS